MADLSWLRIGQRSRTSVATRSPTSAEHTSAQDGNDHQRPVPSRVASHINLCSRFSLPPEPVTSARLTNMLVKDRDKVWHNPSLDQMIEALQVIMMSNGVLAPIPLEYNAYILHLIEGFHDIQRQLDAANGACDEAKSAQDQLSEDFKTVANEWARREAQYKSEVKRLEVILARMSYDGLETVTLARTNSVVDRGEPDPKQFISRLKLRREALHHESSPVPDSRTDNPVFPGKSDPDNVNSLKVQEWIESMMWLSPEDSKHKPPAPLPNILDRDKDFLVSEKIRRSKPSGNHLKAPSRLKPLALAPTHLAANSTSDEHLQSTAGPAEGQKSRKSIQNMVESDSSFTNSDSGAGFEVVSPNKIPHGDRFRPLSKASSAIDVGSGSGNPRLPEAPGQRGNGGSRQIELPRVDSPSASGGVVPHQG